MKYRLSLDAAMLHPAGSAQGIRASVKLKDDGCFGGVFECSLATRALSEA